MSLEDEYIKILLKNVQKPGGGGQGDVISFKSEMNLRLTVLFFHNKNHTSWSVDYSDITIPNIFALKKQQELELAK